MLKDQILGWEKPTKSASTSRSSGSSSRANQSSSSGTVTTVEQKKSKTSSKAKAESVSAEKKNQAKTVAKTAKTEKTKSRTSETSKKSRKTRSTSTASSSTKGRNFTRPEEEERQHNGWQLHSDEEFETPKDKHSKANRVISAIADKLCNQRYPLLTLVICFVIALLLADVVFAVGGVVIYAIAIVAGAFVVYMAFQWYRRWRSSRASR